MCLTQSRTVDKVDNVMDDVRTQLELTTEINDAISNPAAMGIDVRRHCLVVPSTTRLTDGCFYRWTCRSSRTSWPSWSRRNSTSGWRVQRLLRSILQVLRLPVSISFPTQDCCWSSAGRRNLRGVAGAERER